MKTMFVVGHANRERTKLVIAGRSRAETRLRRPGTGTRVLVRTLKVRPYPRGDFVAATAGRRDTVH